MDTMMQSLKSATVQHNMKTIELNEQQVELIKNILEEVATPFGDWSKTYQHVAQQIISKLEEDNG